MIAHWHISWIPQSSSLLTDTGMCMLVVFFSQAPCGPAAATEVEPSSTAAAYYSF